MREKERKERREKKGRTKNEFLCYGGSSFLQHNGRQDEVIEAIEDSDDGKSMREHDPPNSMTALTTLKPN